MERRSAFQYHSDADRANSIQDGGAVVVNLRRVMIVREGTKT